MNSQGLHDVQEADFGEATAVLCEVFAHDPFFEYMLEGVDGYGAAAKAVHSFILTLGRKYGEVHATSTAIEGVAVWLPPGQTRITPWKALASGVVGIRRTLGKSAIPFTRRMIAYSGYSEKVHKKHAPFRHWYLLAIGVRGRCRGMGYASRLVRPMMERCDREGVPCYLETHNPENVGLYKHFGFDVAEVCRLPGTEKPYWAMLRMPIQK